MSSHQGRPRRRKVNVDQQKLTRSDWIEAGLSQLARNGQQVLKIQALCKHLKVTKGSFYCPFSSAARFHQALARNVKQRDLPACDLAIRECAETKALPTRALSRQDRYRHQRMKELFVVQGSDEASCLARLLIWFSPAMEHPARG